MKKLWRNNKLKEARKAQACAVRMGQISKGSITITFGTRFWEKGTALFSYIIYYVSMLTVVLSSGPFPILGCRIFVDFRGLKNKTAGYQWRILRLPIFVRKAFKKMLSQAAACDGLLYSVNFNGQNAGTQGYALPLFED